MRRATVAQLGLIVVILVACSAGQDNKDKDNKENKDKQNKPVNPMLGKWELQENKDLVIEILDAEMKTSRKDGVGPVIVSTYRFLDADTFESETTMGGMKFPPNTYKLVINGDEMTWTDVKLKSVKKWKRLR